MWRFSVSNDVCKWVQTSRRGVRLCTPGGCNVCNFSVIGLGKFLKNRYNKNGGYLISSSAINSIDVIHFKETCPCDDEDFECDFGYKRISEEGKPLECEILEKESLEKISVCYYKLYKNHEKYFSTTGYRKVANDNCTGGKTDEFNSKKSHQFELICTQDDYYKAAFLTSTSSTSSSGGSTILSVFLTFLLVTVVLVLVVFAALVLYKRRADLPSISFPSISPIRITNFNFARFQDEV